MKVFVRNTDNDLFIDEYHFILSKSSEQSRVYIIVVYSNWILQKNKLDK